MYTTMQEKLEAFEEFEKIGLPGRQADSMYSFVQRLIHRQSKVPVG